MSCSFYTNVRIGPAYWIVFATRRGAANPVEPLVPLAVFKRRLKSGDQLRLVHASHGHRHLGANRTVIAVRSKDMILEGPSYLDFPRASGFACDGRLVRIAFGNEYEPDRHLLYEWLPAEPNNTPESPDGAYVRAWNPLQQAPIVVGAPARP